MGNQSWILILECSTNHASWWKQKNKISCWMGCKTMKVLSTLKWKYLNRSTFKGGKVLERNCRLKMFKLRLILAKEKRSRQQTQVKTISRWEMLKLKRLWKSSKWSFWTKAYIYTTALDVICKHCYALKSATDVILPTTSLMILTNLVKNSLINA